MKFDVKYTYLANYIKKGHQNPVRAVLETAMTLDIPVVPTPSAPFCQVGHTARSRSEWTRFPKHPDGRSALVWQVDGRLYVEHSRIEDFVAEMAREQDGHFFDIGKSEDSSRPYADLAKKKDITTYERIVAKAGDLRQWEDDGGAAQAGRIQKRADDCIVVAGWVCVEVGEPVIVVASSQEGSYLNPRPRIVVAIAESNPVHSPDMDSGEEFPSWSGRRFRLDRMEDALSYAEALSESMNLPVDVACSVAIPETFSSDFPQEVHGMSKICANANNGMYRSVFELPGEVAVAWAALRDADYAAPKSEPTPESVDAFGKLVDAIEAVGDLYDWHDTTEGRRERLNEIRPITPGRHSDRQSWKPETAWDVMKQVRILGRHMLEEWERRPRVASERVETALPAPTLEVENGRVEQILTDSALRQAAREGRFDHRLLADDLAAGNRFLRVELNRKVGVAVLNDALEVVRTIGPFGRGLDYDRREMAEKFARSASSMLEMDSAFDMGSF